VLIDPLAQPAERDYFARLQALIAEGAGVTEAVVFDAEASGLPAGASYLFDAEGKLVAHVRGPLERDDAPRSIREHLEPLSARPRPSAQRGVAYLPLPVRCRLVIVGGGHVGQAVGKLAAELDFDVWVVDDRENFVTEERFASAERRIAGAMDEVLPQLNITPNTYCLIVTRGHNHDEEALYYLAQRGAAYVGMIGSKRKIRLIFEDLLEQGIPREALEQVHAPVGIDIGSQTVPEIAVSICAELVSFRNRNGVVPGRPEAVSMT